MIHASSQRARETPKRVIGQNFTAGIGIDCILTWTIA